MIEIPVSHKRDYSPEEITFQDSSKPSNPYISMSEEVNDMKNRSFYSQKTWIPMRLATLNSSRKIVKETFDFESGIEFGCGVYGWFNNFLLPEKINWKQFDINPEVVRYNKNYTKSIFGSSPKISVGSIYNMPVASSSIEVIVGYNSWDSIFYFEKRVEEVKRCLRPRGVFIHYQDLQPASIPLFLTESKKRVKKGLDKKVHCSFFNVTTPIYLPNSSFQIGNETMEKIVAMDSVDHGNARLGNYLIKHLESVFREKGFHIKTCEEKQKEVTVKKDKFLSEIRKFGFTFKNFGNFFGSAYGSLVNKNDETIPEGFIKQWSAMDVFIAQKPH